jgi:2-keto-4-pentenoate hydratase/2-oxohepta-3-ene-1,7-dioic acid hydratase in catechol pathway
VLPAASVQVEHEAEIAVIIGERARNVPASRALDHIVGYAPLNDVTARDLQKTDGQWARAKGFDTFCPMGGVVPIDRIDRDRLEVVCRVNGEERQRGRVSEMAFDIPRLIEYISGIMTLEPGDVIATGTPPGVGFARTPPVFLKSGDRMEVEIDGLGVLSNPVVGV